MPKTPVSFSKEEEALLVRLTRPLPLRVRREMDVCLDMDQFAAALEELHAVMTSVSSRPMAVSPYASALSVQTSWADSVTELNASLGKTDQLAQALIRSIKVMLVLD